MENDSQRYPLLCTVDSPADVSRLALDQLPELCAQVRDFLINSLSKNPGHFASSMGAVELTVALHYVYDTPYDRIVWDVGHQAYVHKLLTGRRERFATNRKLNGLSGFPTPEESEYDTFTAGHASNSISAALGMSVATQLKGEKPKRHVVAVIGDASISGGLAFEGLNNAANTPNNLLIVLNDNDMSIDDNVGSLHSYLTHINTTSKYNSVRYRVYNLLKRLGIISETGRGRIMRFNNAMKSLLGGKQNIFEGLNVRYFGPFDGHDVKKLVHVFNQIKDIEGPKILHIRTVKGKGYKPAEDDPAHWHAPGKFDPETGRRLGRRAEGRPQKYQDVFGQTLVELAGANDRLIAITAAMLSGTSISAMHEAYPARVFDVGISEGHAVTFAGGLAKEGLQPVVGIYSSFLQRAYDHIIHDVAIQRLPVIFAIDRAGLVGEDGVTHHGLFDLAYMRTIPGMTVAAPRNEHWLRNLLYTAQKLGDRPFSIRYPRGTGMLSDWENEMHEVEPGKAEKLAEGADAAVLSIGTMASNVEKALERLRSEGIGAAHYDMVFLKPIDEDALEEASRGGRPIVTVEDGTVNGGLGSAVSEWLVEHGKRNRVVRVGIHDDFVKHGTVDELQQQCGLDADSIYNKIKEITGK